MAKKKVSERQKLMQLQSAGEARDLEEFRDISDDVIESDFVPYACLYDGTTILTKDGELLQTIKITGVGFEASNAGNLRQAIRQAIKEAIPDDSYAIWLHTLRRQQSLATGHTHFPDAFSSQLDQAWRSSLPSSLSYANELYITIVKAGANAPLRDIKTLIQSLKPKRDRKLRSAEIDNIATMLSRTTRGIMDKLSAYGAKLLTVVEREGTYYSEQLEFLEKLINLEERPIELPMRDLSHVLTSGEITFGYNAMEVRTHEGHRRFAAILTLKEYKESTLSGIDKFLEIPCEVIVSQCFSFTGAEMAQEFYAKQARYLSYSGDTELAKWMEIDRLMQLNSTGLREFGQQQTSIFLISSSVRQLEANVRLVQRSLSRLGMVSLREDLRFEECYWAQLPGNFPFVVRQKPVDTEHLAGFANLQSAPMGVGAGSPWGKPVSLFTTMQDTPYFFNFHRGTGAHTILLGQSGTGYASFGHFLLAQARRMPVSIWYLDAHGHAGPFIQALGGKYLRPGQDGLKLNPFHLPETPANRDFLALWLATLMNPDAFGLSQATLALFQTQVNTLLAQPRETRRLSNILPALREADPAIAAKFEPFCAGGIYGDLFDNPVDTFAPDTLIGWDISPWMEDPITRAPLAAYMLHRLTASLNGKPTLLVLDEGFTLLDNPLFASRASGWYDYLTSQNAGTLIMTSAIEASGTRSFTPTLAQKAATIFSFGDAEPAAEYSMGFGFTPEEVSTIAYLAKAPQILQKRGTEAVVIQANLGAFSIDVRDILAGRTRKPATPALSPADQLAALMGLGSAPA